MVIMLLLLGAFAQIEDAYSEGEFEQVAALVRQQDTSNLTVQQKKRVYELGAFAEFFMGHDKQAAHYFAQMFQVDRQATVDERRYPPKAVAFYRQQRDKHQVAAPIVTGTVSPPPPTPREKAGFRAVSLIPFGIGHLILGDVPAGVAFLTVPAALIGTSVALYWVRQGEKLPGDRYENKARADTMQVVQNVAAFAAIAVTIYGVIDATLFAQERVAARQPRVTVVPFGTGLALGIQY